MFHFLTLLFVIIGLHVSDQTTGRRSERSVSRQFKSVLTVPNGMWFGTWGEKEMCPSGTYAAGFSVKVHNPSSGSSDMKELTGIRFHCISPWKAEFDLHEDYSSVRSEVASWGEWTEIQWCPCCFLTAFKLRVESYQGIGDDTAANKIKFKCSRNSELEGRGTSWGEWGGWSHTCAGGICGIKTQVEEPQGAGDDTALNDVLMYCCD